MSSKLRRLLFSSSLVFVFSLVIIASQNPGTAHSQTYGTLSNLTASAADAAKSTSATNTTSTTYTISFTTEHALSRWGGRINFQFNGPNGYTSGTNYNDIINYPKFDNASIDSESSPSSIYIEYRNYNGLTLRTSSDIAGGSTITLKVSNVVNPTQGGYYFAHVWTTSWWYDLDGSANWNSDYNTPYIEIGTNTNFKGRITDTDGTTPVPYTSISMSSTSGNYAYYSTYTDKNGDFGLGDVPARSYNFSISGPYTYGSSRTYFPPDTASVTLTDSHTGGSPYTQNASFRAATKTISGKITKTSESGAAVNNATVWVSKSSGGYANSNVDSNGNFSFNVTGGNWNIGIYATTWPADWSYTTYNESISFTDDNTTESKAKNFVVDTVNSTVTGRVTKPDGSAPSNEWAVGLSFQGEKNRYFSASFDTSGYFTAKVAAGKYSVSGYSSDSAYSFPTVASFTIAEDGSYTMGTIQLIEKTDTIGGAIRDNFGAAVSGASVYAWKNDGVYDWANATTDTNGAYTLKVTPGTWQVSAYPQWDSGYTYSGKPVSIIVTAGVAATKDFTFKKVTSVINGTLTDPDGNILTNVYSWASANDGSQEWSNIGASVDKGTFTLKVPAGTWDVSVSLYGYDYSSPEPEKVTIGDNETKSVTLRALKNDVTVSGTFYDESNNKITGKWISVYASRGKYGSWQNATIDQTTGTYTMKISAGTWRLGWWVDSTLGYSSGANQDIEIAAASGESITRDITLKKADATISGQALKADGAAMQWAWITADTRDPNEKKSVDTYYYSGGASSNNDGNFELKVPAGTYWVGGSMWSGYINPKRQKITVASGETASTTLTFRNADATITGTVRTDAPTNAYVTAWSEDGGFSEANANNEGAYSLSVSSGAKWHIRGMKEIENDVYKSAEYILDLTGSTSATQDIQLEKQAYTLPDGQTLTFDPTKQQTVTLDDGTEILIPANVVADSGSITLAVEPDANLAEESDAKPLDYGYDLTFTSEAGQEITSFNGNITITDTYTDATLSDNSIISAEELTPAYYDETTKTWIEIQNGTVNTSEDTVSYQTNHSTKFALVTAADTTPPDAPTELVITGGDGKARLSWKNPTTPDFAGLKIYRSTEAGALGEEITSISNTTTVEYQDASLNNFTTYYYTIKSFDVSNNLSAGTAQVSVKTGILPITGTNNLNVLGLILLLGLCAYLTQHHFGHRRAHKSSAKA